MASSDSSIDPDQIYDLFWGVFKPQIIRLALILEVFTKIAAGSNTVEQVADACRCDSQGIKRLLDCLCSLGVVERVGRQYSLTLTADTFLVKGRKAYAGDMILHSTGKALFDSIQGSLRSGEPESLGENFVQDAWLESYSSWRIPKSLEMWKAAGIDISPQSTLRILDIACGCAIKSLALAQDSPNIHVTCLDSEDVLEVARDLAVRLEVDSQVVYMPADLLDADLGESCYEAVLTGQITHYLTEHQNKLLFQRIYNALSPGGVFVIDCPMAVEALDEMTSFLSLVLWANSSGEAHSYDAYKTWLAGCGFSEIAQLNERWVKAVKANP